MPRQKKTKTFNGAVNNKITEISTPTEKIIAKTSVKKKQKPESFIARLLCFSNIDASITNPYYALQNIIINQTYNQANYIINIFVESKEEEQIYKKILKPLINPSNIKINFYIKSLNNINDHLIGFLNVEYQKYNMFLYLDYRITYSPTYLQNITSKYNHKYDITEIKTKNNFHHLNDNIYNYILNNKTLDILIKNKSKASDNNWISVVADNKLTTSSILDEEHSFLYIKEQPQPILNKEYNTNKQYAILEDEFFVLCMFEHNFWSSYVYLNKRNNRMYNILNDDHGAFEISENQILIKWDTWGDEIFYKKRIDDKTYFYCINN